MISYLDGILVENTMSAIVLEVGGIGYEVSVPLSTSENLPAEGGRVKLLTYLHVREDDMQLFGFGTRAERELFKLLIATVAGVGPKVALSVLSSLSVDGFSRAISQEDIKTLSKVNGVGKKMAERMVVELRDKLQIFTSDPMAGVAHGTLSPKSESKLADNLEAMDAILALESLWFKRADAEKVVAGIVGEEGGANLLAQEIIKRALVILRR